MLLLSNARFQALAPMSEPRLSNIIDVFLYNMSKFYDEMQPLRAFVKKQTTWILHVNATTSPQKTNTLQANSSTSKNVCCLSKGYAHLKKQNKASVCGKNGMQFHRGEMLLHWVFKREQITELRHFLRFTCLHFGKFPREEL